MGRVNKTAPVSIMTKKLIMKKAAGLIPLLRS